MHSAETSLPRTVRKTHLLGRTIITLSSYKEPSVRDAVGALKFEHEIEGARLLAELLDSFLLNHIIDESRVRTDRAYVVPIPLSAKRLSERGYNQVEKILRMSRVVQEKYAHYEPNLLLRTRHATPQSSLSHRERLTNVHGAFVLNTSIAFPAGAHIYLIDDVCTTGATLSDAARTLESADFSVTCIACVRAK